MTSQLPVPALCQTIKALVQKGDRAHEKAKQFYIAAGKYLVELKERKPAGITWETFLNDNGMKIGRRRADELIQIADGRTTVDTIKERNNQAKSKHRLAFRNAKGNSRSLTVTESEEDEVEDIERDIDPENYATAFLLRADQARAFAAYSGPINHEIVEAARAAAASWNELVQKLEDDRRSHMTLVETSRRLKLEREAARVERALLRQGRR
jgi:hypothetical protein